MQHLFFLLFAEHFAESAQKFPIICLISCFLKERVDLSLRAYVSNLKILLGIVALGFLMNSVLEAYETNFLFLRKPPMEGLPILNLDHGWYVYFLTLAAIACLLVFLVHLPFVIRGAKEKRAARKGMGEQT